MTAHSRERIDVALAQYRQLIADWPTEKLLQARECKLREIAEIDELLGSAQPRRA